MRLKNLYDLYDGGTRICQNMTGQKIAEMIGVRRETVINAARKNRQIRDRYTVVLVGKIDDYKNNDNFYHEWEQATEPFRKVRWVKHPGAGVKRLTIKGG